MRTIGQGVVTGVVLIEVQIDGVNCALDLDVTIDPGERRTMMIPGCEPSLDSIDVFAAEGCSLQRAREFAMTRECESAVWAVLQLLERDRFNEGRSW